MDVEQYIQNQNNRITLLPFFFISFYLSYCHARFIDYVNSALIMITVIIPLFKVHRHAWVKNGNQMAGFDLSYGMELYCIAIQ